MRKWSFRKLEVKTRVCRECKKKKPITEYHFQKPKYNHKLNQYVPDRRTECKSCHYQKVRNAELKRHTAKERNQYQKKYHKTYIHPLMFNYKVLQQYANI